MIKCKFDGRDKEYQFRHVTCDAIVVNDGKILLVKRAPNSIREPNKYAIPGGFMDLGETTEQGVRREVLEETGYQAGDVQFFRFIDNPNRRNTPTQDVDFVYIIKDCKKISEHDDEVTQVEWFPLESLPKQEEIAFDHYEIIQSYLKSL